MPYPSARSLVRILSLSTSALGHPNETIPILGCSELLSLFNDVFAWSGLFNEGLVLILLVVADIYRSESPLGFIFLFLSKICNQVNQITKTSRKDLHFCRLSDLILFIKIDQVISCVTEVKYAIFWTKKIKRGGNWK